MIRLQFLLKCRLASVTVCEALFAPHLCSQLSCKNYQVNNYVILLFSAIFIIWEENHPLKANVFPDFANGVHVFHQIAAQLP